MPHRFGAGATQLDEQAYEAPEVEQSAVGAEHALPQVPQFEGELNLVSQPSSGRLEQWAYPAAQADAGTTHTPAWQVTPAAPATTFCSALQSCPHVPQFWGSEPRFTQLFPQVFGADVGQLETHWAPVVVATHMRVVPAHLPVQLPHVL
ncbi:MAG TPA: hypothetical protein VHM31_05280 [Polyangia bacterium]|nr:hypothetical protein [Polyangia bacterium]